MPRLLGRRRRRPDAARGDPRARPPLRSCAMGWRERRAGSGALDGLGAFDQTGAAEDVAHGVGRLRADAQPVAGALFVDLDRRRLGDRVVQTERLDEPAIPWRAAVGRDDAITWPLLGAHSPEAKFDHASLLPCSNGPTPNAPSGFSSVKRGPDEFMQIGRSLSRAPDATRDFSTDDADASKPDFPRPTPSSAPAVVRLPRPSPWRGSLRAAARSEGNPAGLSEPASKRAAAGETGRSRRRCTPP